MSATRPIVMKYPLDLSGVNPNNKVLGEPHKLPEGVVRAIVPNYGAFYSKSLKVRDAVTGNVLFPNTQFKAVQLYQEATEKTGQEVCSVIIIIDPNISDQIEIDYQAIGGAFSYSVYALRQMIEGLELDNRPILWGDVIGKPSAFPPTPHLHDAGDLYGFEYLVEAIESVRQAILTGNDYAIDELKQLLYYYRDENEYQKDQIKEYFEDRIRALEELEHKATVEQALDGIRDDLVITPYVLNQVFNLWFKYTHHTTSTDLLHELNAEQLGLGDWLDQRPLYMNESYYLTQHHLSINPHQLKAYHLGLGQWVNQTPLTLAHLTHSLNNEIKEIKS